MVTLMIKDSFTERLGITYRSPAQELHAVPNEIRQGLFIILSNLDSNQKIYFEDLYRSLFNIPSIHRSYIDYSHKGISEDAFPRHVGGMLKDCRWNVFFDITEIAVRMVERDALSEFEYSFNELLAENGVQWTLKDGKIERRRPEEIAAVIEKSFQFLSQTGFEEPQLQLRKAVHALDQRPEPDVENCVKDAVGALEGTARTLARTPQTSLKSILDSDIFSSTIHGALKDVLLKVEAYRGDAPGAGHAIVAGKPRVEMADAEFVFIACSAGIIFLMEKANRTRPE